MIVTDVVAVIAERMIVIDAGMVAADADCAREELQEDQRAAEAGTDEEERVHWRVLRRSESVRRVIRRPGRAIRQSRWIQGISRVAIPQVNGG